MDIRFIFLFESFLIKFNFIFHPSLQSLGYAQWQVGQNQDEVFLAAQ